MIEWFEDLSLGMRFKNGTIQILEHDIKQFAAKYDPQPMRLHKKRFSKVWQRRDGAPPQ